MTVLMRDAHQAEPRPDARGRSGVRPCRTVRQHRPRQLVGHRRSARAEAGRRRVHRRWLRLGHGLPEVRRHQVPPVGPPPGRGRHRGHHPGAEDARRRRRGRRRQAARPGAPGGEPRGRPPRRRRTSSSTSRSCAATASRRSSRSTPSRPTTHRRSRSCARSRSPRAREDAVVARHFAEGGAGAEELARAVWAAAQRGAPDFRFLTEPERDAAGADRGASPRASTAPTASTSRARPRRLSTSSSGSATATCPVCMAKTQSR